MSAAPASATGDRQALPVEVYLLGCGDAATVTGSASAQTMGAKAWNLLRMARLALPVPPALVLGTHYCLDPLARAQAADRSVWQTGVHALERRTGHRWGDSRHPLLVSVRSGAPVSMPGMMETLLNIGLCDTTVAGFLRQTGNPRLVWDAYRRLVAGYGEVVAGLSGRLFEQASSVLYGEREEHTLDFAELRALTRAFLATFADAAGRPFPQSPDQQLGEAIQAVLASWQSPKAVEYRRVNQIADDIGTAVTIQAMVFGNAGGRSGAGVGFSRDPRSGEPKVWVDFLFNAQGEDVVSGRRNAQGQDALAEVLPEAWHALMDAAHALERDFGDLQDFEFTVQDGQLFMLQTRAGKRTPQAAARIALDLFDEHLIDRTQARARTAGLDRAALAQSQIFTADGAIPAALAEAAAAGSGVATGEIALDELRALARHQAKVAVILVRRDAETSDLAALEAAAGLLTQHGARTSHAAVVARQLGKVCLVGCVPMQIDEQARTVHFGDVVMREGDLLTLDGNAGKVYQGVVSTETRYPEDLLLRLQTLRTGE